MLGSQIVATRAVWPEIDPLEPSAFPKAFRMKAGMGRAIGCSFRPAYDAHRSIDRLTNSRVRTTRCAFFVGNRSIIIDHRICSPIPKCVDPFRRTRFQRARPSALLLRGGSKWDEGVSQLRASASDLAESPRWRRASHAVSATRPWTTAWCRGSAPCPTLYRACPGALLLAGLLRARTAERFGSRRIVSI